MKRAIIRGPGVSAEETARILGVSKKRTRQLIRMADETVASEPFPRALAQIREESRLHAARARSASRKKTTRPVTTTR